MQVFHSSQQQEKLSWLQAHLYCQRHGANLLSISGPEEEHFVLQVLHEAFGWVPTPERHRVTNKHDANDTVWPAGSPRTSSTGSGSG